MMAEPHKHYAHTQHTPQTRCYDENSNDRLSIASLINEYGLFWCRTFDLYLRISLCTYTSNIEHWLNLSQTVFSEYISGECFCEATHSLQADAWKVCGVASSHSRAHGWCEKNRPYSCLFGAIDEASHRRWQRRAHSRSYCFGFNVTHLLRQTMRHWLHTHKAHNGSSDSRH